MRALDKFFATIPDQPGVLGYNSAWPATSITDELEQATRSKMGTFTESYDSLTHDFQYALPNCRSPHFEHYKPPKHLSQTEYNNNFKNKCSLSSGKTLPTMPAANNHILCVQTTAALDCQPVARQLTPGFEWQSFCYYYYYRYAAIISTNPTIISNIKLI